MSVEGTFVARRTGDGCAAENRQVRPGRALHSVPPATACAARYCSGASDVLHAKTGGVERSGTLPSRAAHALRHDLYRPGASRVETFLHRTISTLAAATRSGNKRA